jgi:membrane protease YdiL (CAAX protease family)
MDASPENPLTNVLLPTGAALIVAIYYRRGFFEADALEQHPRPRVPLTPIDLLPVAAMWVAGALAAASLQQFFSTLGAPPTTSQPASHPFESFSDPALMKNLAQLLLQIVIQLPMILFVFWALLTRTPDAGAPVGTAPSFNHQLAAGLHQFGLLLPDSTNPIPLVKMGLIALVTALPIVFGVNQVSVAIGEYFGQHAPESGHKLLDDFGGQPSTLAIAVLLLSVAFVAPVLEEFVYRGLLQSCLRGIGSRRQTVLIAASVFALMHMAVVPLQVIPGLFALGVMLGWLYERTGSLWPGMILHSGFNLANVVLYFLVTQAHMQATQPTG